MHIHITQISDYDTEINYYNKKSLNKTNYCNFYNDTFNFRKNELICSSQQTDITNSIIDTNTQTTNYIGEHYLHNNKIVIVIGNPTPSLHDNHLWIPGTSDNVVPGIDSMITYIQPKYATLTALQNAITTIDNNVQTEINNSEIPNQGDLNVNK